MHDLRSNGLAAYALKRGGTIHPLIIPKDTLGNETGIMNPSIFQHKEKLYCNIRHINYILYHSETKQFPHSWGPLVYIHPENDVSLSTHNVMCELDSNLKVINSHRVKMTLDTKPTWNFIGLEDARLFNWENRMFLCGVRRDCYDDKGKGRMEMCEIELVDGIWTEISRNPIPAPDGDASYCEKNWMPIIDKPWHYVKWSNPTEVVVVDKDNIIRTDQYSKWISSKQVHLKQYTPMPHDLRGGSQIIKFGEYNVALTHEVNLFESDVGRKDGKYFHRFIVWDNDYNIINYSDMFWILGGHIEFSTGMCYDNNGDVLITFGFQDNAAYVLRIPQKALVDFINAN